MTQYIEKVPIGRIETLIEMERRLLKTLVDPGGCQHFPDPGVECHFLSPWSDDDPDEFSCKGFNPGGDLDG